MEFRKIEDFWKFSGIPGNSGREITCIACIDPDRSRIRIPGNSRDLKGFAIAYCNVIYVCISQLFYSFEEILLHKWTFDNENAKFTEVV